MKVSSYKDSVLIEYNVEEIDSASGYPHHQSRSLILSIDDANQLLKRLPSAIEAATAKRAEIKRKRISELEEELRQIKGS